jgi:hypothetical protein
LKLPYGDAADPAQIVEKLETYALDVNHSSGKHKARLFRSKLGITLDNKAMLVEALLVAAATEPAFLTTSDLYGQRYVIDFSVTTAVGTSMVRSAWIIQPGKAYPRLTSVYPI